MAPTTTITSAPSDHARLPHPGLLRNTLGAKQPFHSPTDTMMTPCTAKLALSKQGRYAKAKPLSLAAQLAAARPKAPINSSAGAGGENTVPTPTQSSS